MRLATRLLAAAALGSLAGCNTSTRGTTQTVTVVSIPEGADCDVAQGGRSVGRVSPTPGRLDVVRSRDDLRVVCTKPGYAATTIDKTAMRTDTMGPGPFALGALVDSASGANNSYPPTIQVTLHLAAMPGP